MKAKMTRQKMVLEILYYCDFKFPIDCELLSVGKEVYFFLDV